MADLVSRQSRSRTMGRSERSATQTIRIRTRDVELFCSASSRVEKCYASVEAPSPTTNRRPNAVSQAKHKRSTTGIRKTSAIGSEYRRSKLHKQETLVVPRYASRERQNEGGRQAIGMYSSFVSPKRAQAIRDAVVRSGLVRGISCSPSW